MMIPRWPTRRPRSKRSAPVYSTVPALTLLNAARALRDGRGHAYGSIERAVLADALEDAATRANDGQIVTLSS